MADNTVTIIGNVTREPELRFTSSGQAVTTFSVAVNRRWQNRQNNEWEEKVSYFDVTCWAQLAENVGESISKGARVMVSGRLEQRSWETDNKEKRSKVEIIADEIGPSLRWATAAIQKNERKDGSGGGSSYEGGGSSARPVSNEPSGGGYNDSEEPF